VKRSRLTRRKGLPPPSKPMARSPLRRESAKHRRQREQTSDPRQTFRETFRTCQLCRRRKARDVHEIVRRSKSSAAVEHRCTWLALCRRCHDEEVADYARWPLARQLALKQVTDPEHHDLETINALRGNSPTEFTAADLAPYLPDPWKGVYILDSSRVRD